MDKYKKFGYAGLKYLKSRYYPKLCQISDLLKMSKLPKSINYCKINKENNVSKRDIDLIATIRYI